MLNNWYQEQKQNYSIITYGINNQSQIWGQNIKQEESKSSCEVTIHEKKYTVNIPVGGEHFVSNSLCAIAVATVFEIPMEKALEGIVSFELTKKRMEIKEGTAGATIINDCYNANYDSMKAALNYLANTKKKRKIAVLGDMLELGDYSISLHEKVGEEVAKAKVNILICVGEQSKYIAKKAQELGIEQNNIFLCSNNEQAIDFLQKNLQKEDIVLLKASLGMKFSQICEAICK